MFFWIKYAILKFSITSSPIISFPSVSGPNLRFKERFGNGDDYRAVFVGTDLDERKDET